LTDRNRSRAEGSEDTAAPPTGSTEAELAQSHSNPQYRRLLAAKKRLQGIGTESARWHEIEVLGDEQNAPILRLSGAASARSDELGLTEWSLSISHSLTLAVAFAVAIGRE
jgi:phosphopantetheinyl transferase (holo-ACP synthase)